MGYKPCLPFCVSGSNDQLPFGILMSKGICSRCGKLRRVAVRQPDGGALCCDCYSVTHKEICAICGKLHRVTARLPDGRAQCGRCFSVEHKERCSKCGEIRCVASRQGGVLCATCYTYASPDRVYAKYKSAAKTRGRDFLVSVEEFTVAFLSPCAYCGEKSDRMGIDRVDSSLGYVPGNIVSCCSCCNTMKSDLTVEEFQSHISKIHEQFCSKIKTGLIQPLRRVS